MGLRPGRRAVDVGGGPGHHAEVFAAAGAAVVVVDPARSMAIKAAATGLRTIVARAEALPLPDGSMHLVYFHLSLHLTEPGPAIGEAARVAAPGGLVAVWTLDADHHRASLLARWFPSVAEIDVARFPDPGDIASLMQEAGLEEVHFHEDTEARSRPAGEWIDAVEGGFVSTLQLLDDDELRRGVAAFRVAYPDPGQRIDYTLAFTGITGRKGSLP